MGLMGLRGKKPPSFSRSAGNDHLCRPKQSVFKSIAAAGLAQHKPFGNLITRIMCNCFMHVWIKLFARGLDRVQSMCGPQVVKLFLVEYHSGIDRRLFALFLCSRGTKLKIMYKCHCPLEQRAVGVLHRLLLLA